MWFWIVMVDVFVLKHIKPWFWKITDVMSWFWKRKSSCGFGKEKQAVVLENSKNLQDNIT